MPSILKGENSIDHQRNSLYSNSQELFHLGAKPQMMAGNPNLWNMFVHPPYYQHQPPPPQAPSPSSPPSTLLSSSSSGSPYFFHPQFVVGSSPPAQPCLNPSSFSDNDFVDHEQLSHSWSQLLLGGLSNEEVVHYQMRKSGNWESGEDEILNRTPGAKAPPSAIDVKPEVTSPGSKDGNKTEYNEELLFPTVMPMPWTHIMMPVSSPTSCVTSLSGGNVWDFSKTTKERHINLNSECNSTATGGACKKARVHPPSSQPPLKVRKEKVVDRITSLHQLVSPFGKTDTASVLLEATGYIRFLQSQIEVLSSPYLRNNNESGNMRSNHHSVRGEVNYTFTGDAMQDSHDYKPKDLRSRGLCLVPVSCTAQVGNENGADYWASAFDGGF